MWAADRRPGGGAVNALIVLLCLGAGESTPAADGYVVAIGGDVSLARGIQARAQKAGWPAVLEPLGRALQGANARIVNLESAVGPCLPGGTVSHPRLCGDDQGLAALGESGITAVTVANNHALDAGLVALDHTADALGRAQVTVLGLAAARSGQLRAEAVGPISVIAANLSRPAHSPGRGILLPTPDALAAAIARSRRADPHRPILVTLHGGREFADEPGDFERAYAESAVAAGAAAVVFHGSHGVHPLEFVQGVPVHFGLGNLLFDQRDPRAAGQVVVLRFSPGRCAELVEVRSLGHHE